MKRFWMLFVLAWLAMGFAGQADAGMIEPGLRDYILQGNPDGMTPVIVILGDRVDTKAIVESMTASHASLAERHRVVVTELQDKAESTQGAVINRILELQKAGEVSEYTSLWIMNVIGVSAKLSAIEKIAAMPQVETIIYDTEIELIKPVDGPNEPSADDIASVEQGLIAIRAPEVWAMGITGQGVLVSSLDTGVDGAHPAFATRWRGLDPRYAGHPEWAWHDPLTNTIFPFDSATHGTHTMGTICGRSTTTADTIGVAIEAEWISAGVVDRGGDLPTRMLRYLIAFQWTMDPDGNPSTLWDVPAVSSNSWGHALSNFPENPCNEYYWETLSNLEAAGVCVVFAAGNEGSTGLRVPANRATDDYNSYSVGAVDGNTSGYPIASFSSRGPSYCTPDSSAAIKPEVSAPGVDVRSAAPGGGYAVMSGTSMATPHIAGVVALIKQANPNLPPEVIKQIMMDTAYDLGAPGNDNSYGWGIVDAYAAVQLALSYLQGYGVITGRMTDLVSGNGLQGHVTVTNHVPPIVANCNTQGYYTLYVPADTTWDLRAEYTSDYLPGFASLSVVENDTVTQDFALEPKVNVVLKASFGNPADIAYRTFYFRGSWDDDGFYNAGWPSSFSAMQDNGVAPDQIAGDGVFTGSMMLATDLVNTYSWAVYSENYNGEASRLQNGADFNIVNPGNPPTVPTLSVNPSGSENNWTMTVYELNSGASLELAPNYNNQAHIWYGSVVLPGGYAGQYVIRVMHSTVAWYGQGGVGGASIAFTPPQTGSYTFYFSDANDLASTGANLSVVPDWLDVEVSPGTTASRQITLTNSGELPLNFGVTEEVDNITGARIENPVAEAITLYKYEGPKPAVEEVNNPPVIMGQGGPDNYGYTWIDSDEPGGPAFNWVDISAIGTPVSLTDDSNQGPFPLPFNFNYYGTNYSSFRICSNGWISFTSTATTYSNTNLPSPSAPLNMMGAMWDDLNPGAGGTVYRYTSADSAVVSWVNVPHYYSDGSYTFQIILLRSGQIFYNYLNMSGDLLSATVGHQNANGTDGLQVAYNAAYIHNNLTVKTSAGWIDVSPASGTIPAGGSQVLTATLDASNIAIGTYTGRIRISSSDAIRTLPEVVMPITMRVQSTVPQLDLSMNPDQAPVQVPPGGNFDYTLGITNNTGGGGIYDGWLMLTLPDNSTFGPLQVIYNIPIAANESQYYDVNQLVPGYAPLGTYIYRSYVGDYPAVTIDDASFPFTVAAAMTSGAANDWSVIGFSADNMRSEFGDNSLPTEFYLSQNYPNPFNAQAVISYGMPSSGNVDLSVYNLLGQKVTTLANGHQDAGYHSITWDAANYSSGIYFYKLAVGEKQFVKRMMLIK
ncbi:MAG: hypothetical protein CO189_01025 [candidate division Zixibacteria bacterium CG_4_9_14_3_um_filter_46_8]|nr:MAG: hypothetical protein CO189_01025 [candidate division Zixibacteria bacterium CG_4_9_14_3_um_filter_46_8]